MRARRLRASTITFALLLSVLASRCGGGTAGSDPGPNLDDATVEMAWGGFETSGPGADAVADAAGPDGRDAIASDAADGRDDAADPGSDTPHPEPEPDALHPGPETDAGADAPLDAPGPVDAAEPAPDLPGLSDADVPPDEPDVPADEPDLPAVPDTAECSVDAHCSDGKACTVDTCVAGACTHA